MSLNMEIMFGVTTCIVVCVKKGPKYPLGKIRGSNHALLYLLCVNKLRMCWMISFSESFACFRNNQHGLLDLFKRNDQQWQTSFTNYSVTWTIAPLVHISMLLMNSCQVYNTIQYSIVYNTIVANDKEHRKGTTV